jgi:hypothetical protein
VDNHFGWNVILLITEFFGLYGSYIVGKRHWWGWLILILHDIPWLLYGIATGQFAFLVTEILWTAIFVKNLIGWREKRDKEKRYGVRGRLRIRVHGVQKRSIVASDLQEPMG